MVFSFLQNCGIIDKTVARFGRKKWSVAKKNWPFTVFSGEKVAKMAKKVAKMANFENGFGHKKPLIYKAFLAKWPIVQKYFLCKCDKKFIIYNK